MLHSPVKDHRVGGHPGLRLTTPSCVRRGFASSRTAKDAQQRAHVKHSFQLNFEFRSACPRHWARVACAPLEQLNGNTRGPCGWPCQAVRAQLGAARARPDSGAWRCGRAARAERIGQEHAVSDPRDGRPSDVRRRAGVRRADHRRRRSAPPRQHSLGSPSRLQRIDGPRESQVCRSDVRAGILRERAARCARRCWTCSSGRCPGRHVLPGNGTASLAGAGNVAEPRPDTARRAVQRPRCGGAAARGPAARQSARGGEDRDPGHPSYREGPGVVRPGDRAARRARGVRWADRGVLPRRHWRRKRGRGHDALAA